VQVLDRIIEQQAIWGVASSGRSASAEGSVVVSRYRKQRVQHADRIVFWEGIRMHHAVRKQVLTPQSLLLSATPEDGHMRVATEHFRVPATDREPTTSRIPQRRIYAMMTWLIMAFAAAASASAQGHVRVEPSLARFPTASVTTIAFVADGNLWSVSTAGGRATRITSDPGQVLSPHFSPDGASIAFTWRRGGANDVYVVSANGGAPLRLTHGPSSDPYDNFVTGWTPDSSRVVFLSMRTSPFRRCDSFEVSASGGLAEPLELGHSGLSSISPDGSRIAFDWSFRNLGGDRWKRYRGGQAGEIFIYNRAQGSVDRLTDWQGIDTAPMWVGNQIFFLSDRGPEGRLNLWVSDPLSKAVHQVTHYADYDIDLPSIGPGGIAFQQGGNIHVLDPSSERVRDISISLPEAEDRIRQVDAAPFVRRQDIVHQPDYALGANGVAVMAARGDLYAMSGAGEWRDLTSTPDHVEDHPAVSPDGRTLAFITDANGEQQVATLQLDHLGAPHILTHFSSGVLYTPRWSPNGKQLSVADAGKRLWLVEADGTKLVQVASDPYAEIQDAAFSANGRKLAYSVTRSNQTRAIHVYDVTEKRDFVLTAALDSDHDPAFSQDGRSLFFISARHEHPFVSDRDREGTVATLRSDGLYKATLPGVGDDSRLFTASATEVPLALAGGITSLQMRGSLLFYRASALEGIAGVLPGQTNSLHVWDTAARFDRTVAADAEGYVLSPDARSALLGGSSGFRIVSITGGEASSQNISLSAAKVTVDLAAERREMFEQAWRLDRDLFWDPNLNGRDWRAVHTLYAPLVVQARSHEDMIYVLGELQGELSTSHMFLGHGDSGDPRPLATTALIGADFVLDTTAGRYRMIHVYRGDNSRSRFRAPLGDPALDVRDGDYLLAVDGTPLLVPDDPYRLLANHKGPLRLTIAHDAKDPGRTVSVDPVDSEVQIRKLDWIASRRAMTDRLSNGRVAYVYLTDFYELGAEDFLRQFYAQTDKAGLVIDDRDNWGGFTSQWVLGVLRRSQAGIFENREGGRTTLPGALAPQHMATVINIFSSSDGDQFPYFFSAWKMGTVVGQRTWGGVRGIKGPWPLMDGTTITIPKDSLLTESGQQIIEGRGAEPDIQVDDTPADVLDGHDAQLERAVMEVINNMQPGP
jgi:tricorn protease